MATIDYKEKYMQALERARQFSEKPYLEDSAGIVEYIFPELKESEDERIRKHIIGVLRDHFSGEDTDKCIAWLEKIKEQKPTDKVEPKFKIGDEIKTKNEGSFIITRIDRWGYWSEDLFICNFDDADKWELVEQEPAGWSEEDQKIWEEISDMLWEGFKKTYSKFSWNEIKDWIKPKIESFKVRAQSQSYWKPGEEQMLAIDTAINVIGKGTLNGKQLIELKE